MKPFSRQEGVVVTIILALILTASLYNFRISLRRTRDSQRRSDTNSVVSALTYYKDETGRAPLSTADGRIIACEPENHAELAEKLINREINTYEYLEGLVPCTWGNDKIVDLISGKVYMEVLPMDPKGNEDLSYKYISNGRIFQLYSYMEGGKDEEAFSEAIVARNLLCGVSICNQGKAYEKTALDKSLEEYENELTIKNAK
ncbi:hypothetical protein IPM62_02920 [Candidatus Woesebacteria bacterium]|nr:MAG: hypothetical protein IPM62_02920 [Candidatus Woesebacteria bacterium]